MWAPGGARTFLRCVARFIYWMSFNVVRFPVSFFVRQKPRPFFVRRNVTRFSWRCRSTGVPRECICDSVKLRSRISAAVFHAPRSLQLWEVPSNVAGFGLILTPETGPCKRVFFKIFATE